MKKVVFLFLCVVMLTLGGCDSALAYTPMNVVMNNQSLLHSPNAVITVVYGEDKRVREKYTDVFVMVDTENVEFQIAKELGEFKAVVIPEKDTWYSLTNLLGANLCPAKFSAVETTTFIFRADQKCEIALKAQGGDLQHNLDNGSFQLVNTFDVSKPFNVKIN